MVQYVSGPLEGTIEDWPPNIQDAIYKASERMADKVKLPLKIVYSTCGIDYADEEGKADRFFLHIILSEIIAADDRYFETEAAMMERIVKEMVRGGTKH
jgi:hypothetical protein